MAVINIQTARSRREAPVQRRTRQISLPARFDTHHIEVLPECAGIDVVINAGAVEFVDEAALAALVDLRIQVLELGGTVRIVEPSTAFVVTVELTGDRGLLFASSIDNEDLAVA